MSLYNEVEADTSLNREALTVVIIVTILSAVGGFAGSLLLRLDIVPAILGPAWAIFWGIAGYSLGLSHLVHWDACLQGNC